MAGGLDAPGRAASREETRPPRTSLLRSSRGSGGRVAVAAQQAERPPRTAARTFGEDGLGEAARHLSQPSPGGPPRGGGKATVNGGFCFLGGGSRTESGSASVKGVGGAVGQKVTAELSPLMA